MLSVAACRAPQPPPAAVNPQARNDGPIGCLGHIEPGDGVVRVAARSISGQPSIVGRLFVKEGDAVHARQPLVELDSEPQLAAVARQAAAGVDVARKRLAQVQAGAKASDIAAQQAEIDRLQAELANAEQEYKRHASLGDNVTASNLDTLKLRTESTTRALAAARQRLASLTEVRPVDVELAQAQLTEALDNEARARVEHQNSVIHSAIDGRVVKIHARPGEQVHDEGVMELAPSDPMYVVAEVAESDIARVKVGQRADISGDGVPKSLHGTVERIAMNVMQNQLQPPDPTKFTDGRIVNVWIKVDDAALVASLIHMRVQAVIQP